MDIDKYDKDHLYGMIWIISYFNIVFNDHLDMDITWILITIVLGYGY